jgi:hypothetical protein
LYEATCKLRLAFIELCVAARDDTFQEKLSKLEACLREQDVVPPPPPPLPPAEPSPGQALRFAKQLVEAAEKEKYSSPLTSTNTPWSESDRSTTHQSLAASAGRDVWDDA